MTAKHASDSQNDLLLRLQEAAGCVYMSDLHLPLYHSLVRKAALSIADCDYPVEAWNAALQYITGTSACYADAGQARAQLIERLDQNA